MKKSKYDKNTLSLIKKLLQLKKAKPRDFTPVDEKYLNLLLDQSIDVEQIKNEKEKCKNDILFFIDNYIYVKNKFQNIDEIPKILKDKVEGDKIKFEMYDIQRELVKAIMNDDKVISTKSRQIGFTTTSLACSLQLITFNNNKTILLFSKSEKDAKDTLLELKFMYNQLPFFLRRTVNKNNEKELILGGKLNSSKIIVQTTGKSSGRSHSATQILFDEADYIQGISDIYRASAPAISATRGKFIVLSTPNLHGSQFHKMVMGAKKKTNGFTLIEGNWQTIPQRTNKQYEEQCSMLNHDKKSIATELNMKQILPYDTYFDEKKLLSINGLEANEIICGIVEQFHKPKKDNVYIISVDCQEEGTHNNSITVYDINEKIIAASVATKMNIFDTLLELSKLYNGARIIIERNRGFYLIKKFEENDLEELLLPNIKYVSKTDKFEFDIDDRGNANKLGFVTTKHTRPKLLIHLSNFIYKSKELPESLLEEARTFIIKRGRPVGIESDDLLIGAGIGVLTGYVIIDSKNKSNTNKKLKYLIDNYQGKTLNVKNKSALHKEKIKRQVSKLRKTMISSSGIESYNTLLHMEELEKMEHSNDSKINKIKYIFF